MSVVAAVPASTVVLLRPGHPFEVFLVRRSDSIAFMGGAHVFPGGRIDASDYIDHVETTIDGMTEAAARMPDVPPEAAVAHHVAALRELFEEAGVLLARPLTATSVERLAAYRRDLLAGKIEFGEIIRAEHLRLALDELAYFAHWVTPEIETRRFDTRFFIARARLNRRETPGRRPSRYSGYASPNFAVRCASSVAIAALTVTPR